MSGTITIRPVTANERAAWEPLWQGYLDFYESTVTPGNNDVLWKRLHDPAEPMFLLGAYQDGRLIGIAHYIFHRSCWTVGDYCYLQDLFVIPDVRGTGAGRKLIAAVEAEAHKRGASRLHWLTKEDNHSARGLYDQVAQRSGFIQYRKIL